MTEAATRPAGHTVCEECEAHASWCDWPGEHTWQVITPAQPVRDTGEGRW